MAGFAVFPSALRIGDILDLFLKTEHLHILSFYEQNIAIPTWDEVNCWSKWTKLSAFSLE